MRIAPAGHLFSRKPSNQHDSAVNPFSLSFSTLTLCERATVSLVAMSYIDLTGDDNHDDAVVGDSSSSTTTGLLIGDRPSLTLLHQLSAKTERDLFAPVHSSTKTYESSRSVARAPNPIPVRHVPHLAHPAHAMPQPVPAMPHHGQAPQRVVPVIPQPNAIPSDAEKAIDNVLIKLKDRRDAINEDLEELYEEEIENGERSKHSIYLKNKALEDMATKYVLGRYKGGEHRWNPRRPSDLLWVKGIGINNKRWWAKGVYNNVTDGKGLLYVFKELEKKLPPFNN